MAVSDMPKTEAFYANQLGFKAAKDYRRDDRNWWVSCPFPENGAAHRQLSAKSATVNQVTDDPYGLGAGLKWFNLEDPEGNQVFRVKA